MCRLPVIGFQVEDDDAIQVQARNRDHSPGERIKEAARIGPDDCDAVNGAQPRRGNDERVTFLRLESNAPVRVTWNAT